MNNFKTIGWLLIIGTVSVIIPYTLLTITFDYPDILRENPDKILTKFHQGGSKLIFTWWCFAISAIPLLIAFVRIGSLPQTQNIKWATTIGVVSVIVQMIGLLRWVFVIPVLSANYVTADNEITRSVAASGFMLIHQFGGVLMGEHMGQLFTIIWTVMISISFLKKGLFGRWKSWLGIGSSLIYLLAQAELFNTVIPGILIWDKAGLIGSTLWLIWLLVIGISFLSYQEKSIFQGERISPHN
jgi:hypothetical protein